MELVLAYHLRNFEIFSDISWLKGIVITRKSAFGDMETGFSSLEILLEPVLVDELKWRDFKYLENFFTVFFYKYKVKKLPL